MRTTSKSVGAPSKEGWSPEGYLLSFGVGAYRPDPGPSSFDVFYPNDNGPLLLVEFDFFLYRIPFIGPIGLGGGTVQVLLTSILAAGVCLMLGLGGRAALALGAMIALSSTACVVRLLVSRAEIDGVYGRNALGMLLLQDIAVVPLVLVVTALGGEGQGSVAQIGKDP